MQKNISTRRAAQKLAKDGQTAKAIQAYEPILTSGSADPYDHLYVGDLYVKMGQYKAAIAQYEAAINEYQNLGFFRNAIAVCRKILRLNAAHIDAHRHLGHLYAKEELVGDALDAYLTFLEAIPREKQNCDEFRDVVARVMELAPETVEVAQRASQLLQSIGHGDDAAELLLRAATIAEAEGAADVSAKLKGRALEIDPHVEERVGPTLADVQGDQPVDLGEPPEPAKPPLSAPKARSAGATAQDEPVADLDVAIDGFETSKALVSDRPAGAGPAHAAPRERVAERKVGLRELDIADLGGDGESALNAPTRPPEKIRSFGDIDFGDEQQEEIDPDDVQIIATGSTDDAPAAVVGGPGAARASLRFPSAAEDDTESMPAGHLADPATATREAIAAEQWTVAQKRADEWIRRDPSSVEAVEKLIEISERLQDNAETVRGLILKGDLYLSDGDLDAALPVFAQVLALCPGEPTARRRMTRFVELGLDGAELPPLPPASEEAEAEPDADRTPASEEELPGLVQQVLEAKEAVVSVQDDVDSETQGWMDIGGLLDEFREGLRGQVKEGDYQAHYDLAVSHMDMELLEEALEEFDAALACAEVPAQLGLRMRELKAKCFSQLKRHREAIHEFRLGLESETGSDHERAGIRFLLAIEHEAVGELDAAKKCLHEALQARPDFTEAAARLASLEDGAA